MNIGNDNSDDTEESITTDSPFYIPLKLRVIFTLLSSVLIVIYCTFLAFYIKFPDSYIPPSDLGINSILSFSLLILFLIWIPWEELGIRIKKIGGIEFQQIIDEQANERSHDIGYLTEQFEELEEKISEINNINFKAKPDLTKELRPLLIKFLSQYDSWAFSPLRIKNWGGKQPGFSEFENVDTQTIKRELQKMVSEELIDTAVSKKGNTLYRIH